MLGESLEPGWHIDDARVSIIIDRAAAKVPECHELRRKAEVCTHNMNAFYGYFRKQPTGEDMERVKKFYEERHDRMIGYLNAAEHALRLILADPHGCAYCDSGKLRNPAKEHDPVCGYFVADQVMSRKYGPLPESPENNEIAPKDEEEAQRQADVERALIVARVKIPGPPDPPKGPSPREWG